MVTIGILSLISRHHHPACAALSQHSHTCRHATPPCNTLQILHHTETHCTTLKPLQHTPTHPPYLNATLFCKTLHHTATHCNPLQHILLISTQRSQFCLLVTNMCPKAYDGVLQCAAACCSMPQCVAVCCSVSDATRLAPCLILTSVFHSDECICPETCGSALQCAAVCCSVLHCDVCCGVL